MTGLRGYGGRHRRQWTIAEWDDGSALILLPLAVTPANRTRFVLMTTGPDKRPEVYPSIPLPSCIVNDGWWLVADSPEDTANHAGRSTGGQAQALRSGCGASPS